VASAASHDFLHLRCRWAGFQDNAGEPGRSRYRVSEDFEEDIRAYEATLQNGWSRWPG
jgi:hypothetical protein